MQQWNISLCQGCDKRNVGVLLVGECEWEVSSMLSVPCWSSHYQGGSLLLVQYTLYFIHLMCNVMVPCWSSHYQGADAGADHDVEWVQLDGDKIRPCMVHCWSSHHQGGSLLYCKPGADCDYGALWSTRHQSGPTTIDILMLNLMLMVSFLPNHYQAVVGFVVYILIEADTVTLILILPFQSNPHQGFYFFSSLWWGSRSTGCPKKVTFWIAGLNTSSTTLLLESP